MTEVASSRKSRPQAKRSLLIGALAAAVLALGVGWYVFVRSPATVPLDDLLADVTHHDVTQRVCGSDQARCQEAQATKYGVYMRFDTIGSADEWATVLGDQGRRWEFIVLDMHEVDLSFGERQFAIETLFAYKDWD